MDDCAWGQQPRLAIAARAIHQVHPEESLTAALAAFEVGRDEEARAYLLHATLNAPRTVAIVLGEPSREAPRRAEMRDDYGGVDMRSVLRRFLEAQSAASKRFFRTPRRSDLFERMRTERAAMAARWARGRTGGDRAAFERLCAMEDFAFARQAVGLPPMASSVGEGASRRRLRTAPARRRATIH